MTDTSKPAAGYPPPETTSSHHPPEGYPPPGPHSYAAPPPPQSNCYYQNNQPNPYYYNGAYATASPSFFGRFLTALFVVLVTFCMISLIMWLIFRPDLPHFQVDSLIVSQLNFSSSPFSVISANWDVRVTVFNANTEMHAYYDGIEATLYYKSYFLARNQLPPFDQGTKSSTTLTTQLVAMSANVDRLVVSGISSDRESGTVNFNANFLAVVRFKAGFWSSWKERWRLLRVYCANLPVGISSNGSNGTMNGGPRKCAVGL
ncbi:hypothetical protein Ancab_007499 [Ancistrocladus abbreviatus]